MFTLIQRSLAFEKVNICICTLLKLDQCHLGVITVYCLLEYWNCIKVHKNYIKVSVLVIKYELPFQKNNRRQVVNPFSRKYGWLVDFPVSYNLYFLKFSANFIIIQASKYNVSLVNLDKHCHLIIRFNFYMILKFLF